MLLLSCLYHPHQRRDGGARQDDASSSGHSSGSMGGSSRPLRPSDCTVCRFWIHWGIRGQRESAASILEGHYLQPITRVCKCLTQQFKVSTCAAGLGFGFVHCLHLVRCGRRGNLPLSQRSLDELPVQPPNEAANRVAVELVKPGSVCGLEKLWLKLKYASIYLSIHICKSLSIYTYNTCIIYIYIYIYIYT